jgi:uncharacterized membrane protein
MGMLGWFHVVCALVALASGAVVLRRRKGTRWHRRTGWVYDGSMLLLNGTALMIYRLTGSFGMFHVGAIFSLATVGMGVAAAVRRRPAGGWLERHYWWMTYSYVGLLAAAVAEVATRTPGFRFWWAVIVASALVLGVGGWMIRRGAAASLAPFRRRMERERIPIPAVRM